jgi:hypothetical protein
MGSPKRGRLLSRTEVKRAFQATAGREAISMVSMSAGCTGAGVVRYPEA